MSQSSEDNLVAFVDDISSPTEKYMIRGYTGFRPEKNSIVGEPSIPNEAKQHRIRELQRQKHAFAQSYSPYSSPHHQHFSPTSRGSPYGTPPVSSASSSSSFDQHIPVSMHSPSRFNASNNAFQTAAFPSSPLHSPLNATAIPSSSFRAYAKHMDLLERYNSARQTLFEKGQTPEILLRIVQSKFSERVSSYANQQIRTRKLFEAFDFNSDGVLNEHEFRCCLEKLNIQFDDVQVLSLFSFFDRENVGVIPWPEFANHLMIQNPGGATGVLPKMITSMVNEERRDKISVGAARRFPMPM